MRVFGQTLQESFTPSLSASSGGSQFFEVTRDTLLVLAPVLVHPGHHSTLRSAFDDVKQKRWNDHRSTPHPEPSTRLSAAASLQRAIFGLWLAGSTLALQVLACGSQAELKELALCFPLRY